MLIQRQSFVRVALGLALGALWACGAPPVAPEPAPAPIELEFEALVLEADSQGAVTEVYDAEQIFQRANDAAMSHDFEHCVQHYERLLRHFPSSRFAFPSLYNLGLCLEELRQFAQAAASFRRYAQLATQPQDRRDGEFRMGANLVKTGNYPEAIHLYDRLLKEEDLGPADRAECHLRRAIARSHVRDPGQVERDLKAAQSYVREAWGEELFGNDLLAEIYFQRGALYAKLAHKVALKLPVDRMGGQLADKARFFRQAQSAYIDALNVQHAYWATAAGLRLGELYERFYLDVLNAQVPADFDRDTLRYYRYELRKALTPLLEQSLVIYEKNMTMSVRLGTENEWVRQTEAKVSRIRDLIQHNLQEKEPALGEGGAEPAEGAAEPLADVVPGHTAGSIADLPRPNAGAPEDSPKPNTGAPEDSPKPNTGAPEDSPKPNTGAPEPATDSASDLPKPTAGTPEDSPEPAAGAPEGSPKPNAGAPEDSPRPNAGAPEDTPKPNTGAPEDSPKPATGAPEPAAGAPEPAAGAPEASPKPAAESPAAPLGAPHD